ncbi:MAG: hypothetical protein WA057_00590 [Candidatus Magasanikiibacteriota bacterium]
MDFLLSLLKSVSLQIIGILGIFFAFGFVLSKLQEWTQKNYRRSVGWKGILWTAWMGTPIHEFGHIFFAKLFRHKINRIAIFEPNEDTGELGCVDHSYKKYSLYQRLGNFFIGAGPMIFGSLFLVIMLYLLLPNGKEIFSPLTQNTSLAPAFFVSLKQTLLNLFSLENLTAWNFWLFLYVSFCIASHLAPSKPDRKGMWGGFFWIVLLLIIINIITLLFHFDITNFILKINQYLGIFTAIFTYTLLISLLHFILSGILLYPFRKVR